MFLVFGKCPVLLRWKNVLSVSHPLHLRLSRNKSFTRAVISVNRPFIMQYISGKRAFSRYISGIHAVIAWLLCPSYRSREPQAAYHRITKFYTFLSVCLPLHIRSAV